MKRGGKREGAGRPRTSTKTTISVVLDEKTVEQINEILDNQSRSAFIQAAIVFYLENHDRDFQGRTSVQC